MYQLPTQAWFSSYTPDLAWMNVALVHGMLPSTTSSLPQGWLASARTSDPSSRHNSLIRTSFKWRVTEATLQALLAGDQQQPLLSPAVYIAGTGVQLWIKAKKLEGSNSPTSFRASLKLCDWSPPGVDKVVCTAGAGLAVRYEGYERGAAPVHAACSNT
jgi:hypothetical protein